MKASLPRTVFAETAAKPVLRLVPPPAAHQPNLLEAEVQSIVAGYLLRIALGEASTVVHKVSPANIARLREKRGLPAALEDVLATLHAAEAEVAEVAQELDGALPPGGCSMEVEPETESLNLSATEVARPPQKRISPPLGMRRRRKEPSPSIVKDEPECSTLEGWGLVFG